MTLQHKEGRASDVQCGVYPSFAFHVFTSRARMRRPVGLHHTPGSARVSQQVLITWCVLNRSVLLSIRVVSSIVLMCLREGVHDARPDFLSRTP
jgi:hypothetical protein